MDNLLTGVRSAKALMEAAFAAPVQAPVKVEPSPDGNMLDNSNGNGNGSGNGEFLFDDVKSVITDEMRVDAAAVVSAWADTDDLGEGEGFGDRLYALVVGTASDGDGDADLTDDESAYAADVAELVGDYLEDKGIDDGDIDSLLDNFDNDVAARVHDALLDKMPQGDEAMMDDTDKFIHGDGDDMMDATYRKVVAIRKGKKVRISKRIGGTVRLTAAQKIAVKKMQRKAFSGTAKRNRAKSMRIRMKMIGK
jgi:hypothetical protein